MLKRVIIVPNDNLFNVPVFDETTDGYHKDLVYKFCCNTGCNYDNYNYVEPIISSGNVLILTVEGDSDIKTFLPAIILETQYEYLKKLRQLYLSYNNIYFFPTTNAIPYTEILQRYNKEEKLDEFYQHLENAYLDSIGRK